MSNPEDEATQPDTRVLYWSKEDTPIPKKGQVLENMFNERYKVISAVKQSEDVEITLKGWNNEQTSDGKAETIQPPVRRNERVYYLSRRAGENMSRCRIIVERIITGNIDINSDMGRQKVTVTDQRRAGAKPAHGVSRERGKSPFSTIRGEKEWNEQFKRLPISANSTAFSKEWIPTRCSPAVVYHENFLAGLDGKVGIMTNVTKTPLHGNVTGVPGLITGQHSDSQQMQSAGARARAFTAR